MWSTYDKDGSGQITKDEAAKLLSEAFGENENDQETIKKFFE